MIPCSRNNLLREQALQKGYDLETAEVFGRLTTDFPEFNFKMGMKFVFKPPKTVVFGSPEPHSALLALHEVSHAILQHRCFKTDIERLKMENAAWEKARELANVYGIELDEDLVQDELDTYRDWLHQKSRCPVCGLTRFQTPDAAYHCPRCENF